MFAPKQRKDIEKYYKILETLGQGSYGCVKRIQHKDLKEDRALKIIKKKTLKSESSFLNEISIMQSLDHPNVLKYYECFEDEFNYYIVMEYCNGGELLNYILSSELMNEYIIASIMK